MRRSSASVSAAWPLERWSAVAVVAALLFCALFVSIGADTYWAVALGRDIVRRVAQRAGPR